MNTLRSMVADTRRLQKTSRNNGSLETKSPESCQLYVTRSKTFDVKENRNPLRKSFRSQLVKPLKSSCFTLVLNSGLVFPAERHSEINGDTLRNTKLTVPIETKFYA